VPIQTPPTGLKYLSLSADTLVKTGEGTLYMIKVASSSSGSIKVWDNTAGSGTVILDTMAVEAKEEHYIPAQFTTGLYVDVTGTVNVTVFYI
jgi:hypothetical protein